jgi:hypothetical protein
VAGVDPLRVYLYKEGIARFATENYEPPNGKNMGNVNLLKLLGLSASDQLCHKHEQPQIYFQQRCNPERYRS